MARALRERGVEVTLIGSYQQHPIQMSGPTKMVWIGPARPGWLYFVPFLLRAWIRVLYEIVFHKNRVVILDVATFCCAFPVDVLSKLGLVHVRVVMDLRTFDFGSSGQEDSFGDRMRKLLTIVALLYGRMLHFGLSAITPRLASRALELGGNRHVTVWGSGHSAPPTIEVRSPHPTLNAIEGLAANGFLVLYHGSITENRGLARAIDGIRMARQRGARVFFAIVGSGPAEGLLKDRIKELDCHDCVGIFPAIPQAGVFKLISYCRLGVMTYPDTDYWSYNYPIKLAEFLAMGKPVLCTDIQTFKDAVGDPRCLVIVRDAKPETIADAILACIQDPDAMALRSGVAERQSREMTWGARAGELLQFIQD